MQKLMLLATLRSKTLSRVRLERLPFWLSAPQEGELTDIALQLSVKNKHRRFSVAYVRDNHLFPLGGKGV